MKQGGYKGLIPEWAPQDAVLMAWPTEEMDWAYMLDEAEDCYRNIVAILLDYIPVIVLSDTKERVLKHFASEYKHKLIVLDGYELNDTWARDFSPLSVSSKEGKRIVNYGFNAWGLKFAADRDNQVGRWLHQRSELFDPVIPFYGMQYFVYEGGALESNGEGLILTTSDVYNDHNRSWGLSEEEKRKYLLEPLCAKELIVLDCAPMVGDDTDGHIDTMARFTDSKTIVYNYTADTQDPNYAALKSLKKSLEHAIKECGLDDFRLIPLPIPAAIMEKDDEDGGSQLPATYANFLITNGAVVVPLYGDPMDTVALEIIQSLFPDREVHGVNCRALIRQHGSLHCVTIQFPQGFIRKDILL